MFLVHAARQVKHQKSLKGCKFCEMNFRVLSLVQREGLIKMATTVDKGMEYVSQIGARLAAEYSLDLTSIEWPQIREDVERKVRTLILSINSDSIAEKFTDENLEAVTEDKKIRTRIEARLINALKTYIATELSDHDIEIEDPSEEEEGPTLHYSISSYGADYPVDALVKRKLGRF
jgi:hypothetical protein